MQAFYLVVRDNPNREGCLPYQVYSNADRNPGNPLGGEWRYTHAMIAVYSEFLGIRNKFPEARAIPIGYEA